MSFPHRRVDASILSSIVVSLRTADSRTQGPDDEESPRCIAYADINVGYRSEPELSAVLLVLRRLQNAIS